MQKVLIETKLESQRLDSPEIKAKQNHSPFLEGLGARKSELEASEGAEGQPWIMEWTLSVQSGFNEPK
jgi:hypothetical protein